MEEIVGTAWHKIISRWSYQGYPDAGVSLTQIDSQIAVFFRAMGGNGALRITEVTSSKHGARQNVIQRIAGSGLKAALASCDNETLRLPPYLDSMPTIALNRSHYFWLAALASISSQALQSQGTKGELSLKDLHWAEIARRRTLYVLSHYPGLKLQYQALVEAHLRQRPSVNSLPKTEADEERQIRLLLTQPEQRIHLPHWQQAQKVNLVFKHKKSTAPVTLWLNPFPPTSQFDMIDDTGTERTENNATKSVVKTANKRQYQAEQIDYPEENEASLLAIRHETDLFSLSEMLKIKRAPDENEELDSIENMADDLDYLSIAKDEKISAKRIQIDLDLREKAFEHERLAQGQRFPEWHYKKQKLIPDICRTFNLQPEQDDAINLPSHLIKTANQLKRQFMSIRNSRHWQRNQEEGDELDLESYINFYGQLNKSLIKNQPRCHLFQKLMSQNRDIATLVLADLSLSTQANISDEKQVIDVIKDSLYLFAECLHGTEDAFALYGFNSNKRDKVNILNIKSFKEKYNSRPLHKGIALIHN